MARELLRDGLAPATHRAYRRSVATFKTFCASHKLRPLPASERTILRFLASLSIERTSHGLATAHLSGLRHWHAAKGYRWPGRTERIRLALRAISKSARPHSRPKRQPMTVPTLLRLQRRLDRSRLPRQDRLAAWAAVTLGFFGALRGSEYLAPSASSFHSRRSCLQRHVTIRPDMLELRIPASKTDQVFQGAVVTLPRLDGAACPVRAMKRYLASTTHLRGHRPLFARVSGAHATMAWLNGLLRRHLDDERLTTHSLRIGFATAAAAAGASEGAIKASGRWKGSTYSLSRNNRFYQPGSDRSVPTSLRAPGSPVPAHVEGQRQRRGEHELFISSWERGECVLPREQ